MEKWKNAFNDNVTESHEQAVLRAAMPLIRQNAERATREKNEAKSGRWIYLLFPALAAGALAIFLIPQITKKAEEEQLPPAAALSSNLEIAMDFELYQDLREIEKLELLLELGDTDKWVTRKPKPRKI